MAAFWCCFGIHIRTSSNSYIRCWSARTGPRIKAVSDAENISASHSAAVLDDDDKSTVRELSEDGLSHDGTVVPGGLRRDSE